MNGHLFRFTSAAAEKDRKAMVKGFADTFDFSAGKVVLGKDEVLTPLANRKRVGSTNRRLIFLKTAKAVTLLGMRGNMEWTSVAILQNATAPSPPGSASFGNQKLSPTFC